MMNGVSIWDIVTYDRKEQTWSIDKMLFSFFPVANIRFPCTLQRF